MVTDNNAESKCDHRHRGTDGNPRTKRQTGCRGRVVVEVVYLVWLGVKRDNLLAEHAGVVVLDLEVDGQDECVPVAVFCREGAVEGVHTPNTATNVGLFAGAISTVTSNVGDVAGVDPNVVARAIIARVGAKEVVLGAIVTGPVFGERRVGFTNGVILDRLKGVTVAIGPGRVGGKDLVSRVDGVSVLVLLGLAIVRFDRCGARGALVVHAFASDRDAGTHEGVLALTRAVIDALLFEAKVVKPAFSVVVSGGFAVFRSHGAASLSGVDVLATAETGVVFLSGIDRETHRLVWFGIRRLVCKWKRQVARWKFEGKFDGTNRLIL